MMRQKKRLEAKLAKSQNRAARLKMEEAINETLIAELEEKIAKAKAETTMLKDILDKGRTLENILQKKLDYIPLLPHEEAILNSSTMNLFVKGSEIRF